MSDFTTTLQHAYREFCIQAHGAGVGLRNRVAEQRGQTAAEYMGILLFVAVIIGALIAADVDGKIAKAANDDGRQDRRRQGKALAHLPKPAGPRSRIRAPEPAPRFRGAFSSGTPGRILDARCRSPSRSGRT